VIVTDALGREVRIARPPRRIVSLVPSETESVATLAGIERLVGRTEFCVEPAGEIDRVPVVGGTKKHDVARVIALGPDLVLANQEENGRQDVERLIAAGLTVHVSFPCTLRESLAYLEALVRMLEVGGAPAIDELRAAIDRGPAPVRARVFAPIWRDPWMTFDGRTYASDLCAFAGAENAYADRARRFPLAAELGRAEPIDAGERDTRYPRTSLEEVARRTPSLVLVPDEPYAFSDEDAAELAAIAPTRRVSGKDLFWYGVRSAGAIARLRALLAPPA
jgi:ABC-type Fe3+-hydroxamate transport system substrate-binding protein